ncbi:MAG: hypothetical protein P4L56_05255 [Candidatus Sulfopaludibacter sp.]|nr:hypothetical protein [Candidatus Sulfopaludibacter sp.]
MSPEVVTPSAEPRDKRAFNAYRHGLAGHVLVIKPHDDAAYRQHCQALHQDLAPAGAMEADLVQSIADDRWRLKRAAAIDNNMFSEGINEPSQVITHHEQVDDAFAMSGLWGRSSKQLALLTLYENRIQRRVEKNMALFLQLQQTRLNALQKLVEEAAILGETYNFPPEALPPQFVHSFSKIRRLANHYRRLTEAQKPPRRAA